VSKFVGDLLQIAGFLTVLQFPPRLLFQFVGDLLQIAGFLTVLQFPPRLLFQFVGDLLQIAGAIFQLCDGENKIIFNEMMMRSALYQSNTPNWIFTVLAH
jgi:hypothetical protein